MELAYRPGPGLTFIDNTFVEHGGKLWNFHITGSPEDLEKADPRIRKLGYEYTGYAVGAGLFDLEYRGLILSTPQGEWDCVATGVPVNIHPYADGFACVTTGVGMQGTRCGVAFSTDLLHWRLPRAQSGAAASAVGRAVRRLQGQPHPAHRRHLLHLLHRHRQDRLLRDRPGDDHRLGPLRAGAGAGVPVPRRPARHRRLRVTVRAGSATASSTCSSATAPAPGTRSATGRTGSPAPTASTWSGRSSPRRCSAGTAAGGFRAPGKKTCAARTGCAASATTATWTTSAATWPACTSPRSPGTATPQCSAVLR